MLGHWLFGIVSYVKKSGAYGPSNGVGMGLAWGWHGVGVGLARGWLGVGLSWGWRGAVMEAAGRLEMGCVEGAELPPTKII